MSSFVHPTAVIDPGAEVGEGTKVWHFAHVCDGARVGKRCVLGQNVFVGRGVRLGDRVKVQNNVSIYEGVEVEDDVFLGPSCVFTNVNNPRAFIERKDEFRPTRVGRGASVGANATVVCGHDVGAYAFVGAGAVVTRDVAPHALVVGNPARQIGWMSRAGERLPEGSNPTCPRTGERYSVDADGCRPVPGDADTGERAREGVADSSPIPMLALDAHHAPLLPAMRAAFDRVLTGGHYILGEEVERFEQACGELIGVPHAIGVSSGTDALLVALMALDVGPGDEVITTAFSFFATAGAVLRLGATPVFVDIDPRTYTLDVSKVEAAVTDRTRAIMPVHLFGRPAAMHALTAVAKRRGLPIIEDAAQALGAGVPGARVGALGALGAFSFFPSKNVGALGDAGLVTTTDDELAARVRLLRHHGMKPKYVHTALGGNFRIDALQAALLAVKLPHAEAWAEARRTHARLYAEHFCAAGLPAERLLAPEVGVPGHVWNQFVIRTPARDALRAHLSAKGIATEVYYPLGLHQQPLMASLGHEAPRLPETERACREVLALPVFPELGAARVARVAAEVISFIDAHAWPR